MSSASSPAPVAVPGVPLHDGTTIPQLGLGTWAIRDDAPTTVGRALELGYRHVDTAQMYHNEEGVGRALESSGLPREELFVTTKLDNPQHDPRAVRPSLEESLTKLRLDHVDLFLIHWPLPARGLYQQVWEQLLEARARGLTTSVGVSNFLPEHLDGLQEVSDVVPVVNQVELHPYFANAATTATHAERGIVTQAWSPIAKGRVADDATVRRVAEQVGRTPVQVTLRWHVQHGRVVIPKSSDPGRMVANAAVFDFRLDEEQMAALDGLDAGEDGRLGKHPATFGG